MVVHRKNVIAVRTENARSDESAVETSNGSAKNLRESRVDRAIYVQRCAESSSRVHRIEVAPG